MLSRSLNGLVIISALLGCQPKWSGFSFTHLIVVDDLMLVAKVSITNAKMLMTTIRTFAFNRDGGLIYRSHKFNLVRKLT